MFLLIELFVKLLILPFKVLWEILELLAHANHRSHRRRSRGHRPGGNSNVGLLVLLGLLAAGLLALLVVGVVRDPSTLLGLLVCVSGVGGIIWLCVWLGHRGQPESIRPKVAGDICNTAGLDPTFFHGVGVGHLCQLPVPHSRHVCRCGGSWLDTDYYTPTDR